MLIWINHEALSQSLKANAEVDAFNALGEAGYHGRHAVLAPRGLLSSLATLEGLSRIARAYYSSMAESATQLGALFSIGSHIVADASVAGPVVRAGVWHVPLALFQDPDYSRKSELLCEDLSDCVLLEKFAEVYVRRNYPLCSVAVRSVAGGGNATAASLHASSADPNPFCLCVVDSDRELPSGALGETARRCVAAYIKSWRVRLIVLDARELENLLPVAVIRAVQRMRGLIDESVDHLHLVSHDLAFYGCFKSGERPCRFHNVPEGHGGKGQVTRALRETARVHPRFRECGGDCAERQCAIFPRLGDGFLRYVIQWIEQVSYKNPALDTSNWYESLEDAVRSVAIVGMAFPRRII